MGPTTRSRLGATLVAAIILLASGSAGAKPRVRPVLDLESVRVHVVIEAAVVTTTIEQTWRNRGPSRREIDLLLPVPAGAAVNEYRMTVGAEALAAELLPRAEAKRAYVETVRRMQDPALLKHAGTAAVRARAFPVEPGSTRTIRLRYRQVLRPRDGILRHTLVPAPDRPEHDRIGTLDIRVEVKPGEPLVGLYSPTHRLDVQRLADGSAVGTHHATQARPGKELLMYAARSSEEIGMRVLTHRVAGEHGYFLLLGAPRGDAAAQAKAAAKRTVLFVFDRSGSMKGRKIEQVKGALRFCLHSLLPTDRFNVIAFNDAPQRVFEKPRPATKESVRLALDHVSGVDADGGTNIQDALFAALDDVAAGEPADVIFLTDGLPTVGEKDAGTIRAAVHKRNEGRARLFTFGVGDDVNVTFLDKLALDARGFPSVVRPTEDVEVAVSTFFRGITQPALQDLELVTGGDGVAIYDLQPRELPDLFHGSSLAVLGRYRGEGPVKLILSGVRNGRRVKIAQAVTFPATSAEAAFLPSLWAARKIGHLIDDIRAHGPTPELVDSVVSLAMTHGIVTEYTAFLLDLETQEPTEVRRRAAEAFREGGRAWRGGWAQAQVRSKEMMKHARSMRDAGGFQDRDGRWVDLSSRVARIGRLVFTRDRHGMWSDSRIREAVHAPALRTDSARYRQLVASSDVFARIAALGAPVIVLWEGSPLHIIDLPAAR